MITIDTLSYQSNLRFYNAGEKAAYAVLTLLICVVSRSVWAAMAVLLCNSVLLVRGSGINFGRYLHFMMVPMTFLLLSTLAILINVSASPMDAFAVPVGRIYLTGSRDSILLAIQLILTALASVSCLYFLSFTTPMTDILLVLKKIRCPGLIIELMLLIYRFIFVLQEIAYEISVSQAARLGNVNFRTACKSFGALGSVLFLRAFRRSNELYQAMEARCYDGTIRVLNVSYRPRKREILAIAGADTVFLALALAEILCRR